jgi:hypothetical protein
VAVAAKMRMAEEWGRKTERKWPESESLGAVHWSLQQTAMPIAKSPVPQYKGSSAIHLIYEGSRNRNPVHPTVQCESRLLRQPRKSVRNEIQISENN